MPKGSSGHGVSGGGSFGGGGHVSGGGSVGGGAAFDDGCGGACGALCFEADPELARTEERWTYVGAGHGTYTQASSMDYVGHGRGDFEKEKVTVGGGVRFRAMCAFFLCFLLFVILGLLIYLFWPFYSSPGADVIDPCAATTAVGAMPAMQREACCAQGYGAFCTATKAPVIIHDKYYTNVRTEHVPHTVTVPIPGPPAKVITQKVYVKHHPFDCTEGYASWKTLWSHEHQRYCCYKLKEACVSKVQYRNHYKTITHVKHVTVPVKVSVPAPPPREINHIVKVPVHDPRPIIKIKTAGPPHVVKHYITKKHYVPEPVPSPPTYRYKPVAVPVKVPGKVVHVPVPMPAQTIYKEIPITKVQHVIKKKYYDCVAGFKNWNFGWSKTKKSWCCSHEEKGCPGTWKGEGLTKTIVTGVTQHLGHGQYIHGHYDDGHYGHSHVHVIHHIVHHYSSSDDDLDMPDGGHGVKPDTWLPDSGDGGDGVKPDTLPDSGDGVKPDTLLPDHGHGHNMVIGGDESSLPPEYRHGDMSDMSIGGDESSLPPEYRHGDMSDMVVGDDDSSLPPEYRHGAMSDMSIGGDDSSLPPEYRHGDMSTDDDESLPRKLRDTKDG